tara:strand:- start:81 stop:377 length:297 start_codon:yes stop_codon:yes gene_type:complete
MINFHSELKHTQYHLTIHGKVQGVYFRQSSQEIATKLNLCGWVKNNTNKTVSMLITGSKENCKQMINWCKKGSNQANVTAIQIQEEPITYLKKQFTIQ